MHELPVTQSMLDIALDCATKAGARRITDIHLVMGELSTNVDESVQFYWDIIAKGTLAEGARLHFRRIPAELQCISCGTKYGLDGGELVCPNCGSAGSRILAGEEFSLEAIDIDDQESR
jgi:hydrogenase nickel incorporation protein HypA/HybF